MSWVSDRVIDCVLSICNVVRSVVLCIQTIGDTSSWTQWAHQHCKLNSNSQLSISFSSLPVSQRSAQDHYVFPVVDQPNSSSACYHIFLVTARSTRCGKHISTVIVAWCVSNQAGTYTLWKLVDKMVHISATVQPMSNLFTPASWWWSSEKMMAY